MEEIKIKLKMLQRIDFGSLNSEGDLSKELTIKLNELIDVRNFLVMQNNKD